MDVQRGESRDGQTGRDRRQQGGEETRTRPDERIWFPGYFRGLLRRLTGAFHHETGSGERSGLF